MPGGQCFRKTSLYFEQSYLHFNKHIIFGKDHFFAPDPAGRHCGLGGLIDVISAVVHKDDLADIAVVFFPPGTDFPRVVMTAFH